MGHFAEPSAAHHALITDLHAVMSRYYSLPALERIAVLAQVIGQQTLEVPQAFTIPDVLQCVAGNIAQGNQAAAHGAAVANFNGRGG